MITREYYTMETRKLTAQELMDEIYTSHKEINTIQYKLADIDDELEDINRRIVQINETKNQLYVDIQSNEHDLDEAICDLKSFYDNEKQ